MFGLFKNKKSLNEVATNSPVTVATEIISTGGNETTTKHMSDGTVSIVERTVTPEMAIKEEYENLHTGLCSVCCVKGKPVNKYNVCADCNILKIEEVEYTSDLRAIFYNLNKETFETYTQAIFEAEDLVKKQALSKELVEFCMSCGIAGKVYIDNFIHRVTAQSKYNTKDERMYREVFSWWK